MPTRTKGGADNGGCEIHILCIACFFATAALGAEDHAAANAHQQAQAIDDVSTGATTASAAVPSGAWYCPTIAISTME